MDDYDLLTYYDNGKEFVTWHNPLNILYLLSIGALKVVNDGKKIFIETTAAGRTMICRNIRG
jgi:signal-transduction protein with cAMP-binding, CBS, and nucleotidyltransferase domain